MPMMSSSFGGSIRGYGRTLGSTVDTSYQVLTYTGTGNYFINNNGTSTVQFGKNAGGAAWDTQVYSATPFTAPCTIEFQKNADIIDNGASYAMISWNADPTSDASYSSLDYAPYLYDQSRFQVYHNGTNVAAGGSWNSALTWYLVYATNGFIYHYNGSNLLYSANYGVGLTVYVDSSFYYPNSYWCAFNNVRVKRQTWNGTAYV